MTTSEMQLMTELQECRHPADMGLRESLLLFGQLPVPPKLAVNEQSAPLFQDEDKNEIEKVKGEVY